MAQAHHKARNNSGQRKKTTIRKRIIGIRKRIIQLDVQRQPIFVARESSGIDIIASGRQINSRYPHNLPV